MNTQEYIEANFKLSEYSETNAEILVAMIEELPFESFTVEEPYLRAYIQKEDFNLDEIKEVVDSIDNLEFKFEFSYKEMPITNWNEIWESQFEPIIIDDRCTIKASFHTGLKETKYTLIIDPKMAFGTGHHQTTYMMCEHILNNEAEFAGKIVMDMGCGTGILSILAAKAGAAKVYGIDIDSVAAESAFENAELNQTKIETSCGDASSLKENSYDIILANINRNILIQDMASYVSALKEDGLLFVSGFYEEDMPMLTAVAENNGLMYVQHEVRENWCSIKFAKKS